MPIFRQSFLQFLLLLATLCCSLTSLATVTKQEYFSYVIVCGDASPKLLDLVEASLLREQEVPNNIYQSQNEEEILAFLANNLLPVAPRLSRTLISHYRELKKTANISTGIQFVMPKNPDNLLSLEDCQLKPLATHILTFDDWTNKYTNKILIDKKFWDKLKLSEQVAVLLDFALTKESLDNDLISSRIFTGFLFSNSFKNMTPADFRGFLQQIEFPYFEYRELNVAWKDSRFGNDNTTPLAGNLFHPNPIIINGQNLILNNLVAFSANGNITHIDIRCSDTTYKAYFEENSFINVCSFINFFDTQNFDIHRGRGSSPQEGTTYKGHTLFVEDDFEFASPKVLKYTGILKAKVKIRNQYYTLTPTPPGATYKAIGKVSFFPNGNVECGTNFDKDQIFYRKNMQKYKTSYSEYLCFDESGFVIKTPLN